MMMVVLAGEVGMGMRVMMVIARDVRMRTVRMLMRRMARRLR